MTHLRLERMTKRYDAMVAVDSIDLTVQHGEFLVLLGPSGCGKTTTLRCIAGLEEISDGQILIDNVAVSTASFTKPPEQRTMGMVFQSYAVWPHMTVFENIAFGLKIQNLSRADIATRVATALDMVNLGHLAQRGIHQLSGGQQQRVALARAVALQPRVLLFDEPLSNLDAQLREHMRFELRQLQQRLGITAVYVTHDQQEAMVVADRIVLMNKGRIEQVGTPREMYRHPASLFAAGFVGLTNTMAGRVVADGQGGVLVKTDDGLSLRCAAPGQGAGGLVHAVFRPEHLVLSAATESGENRFAAQVVESVFLGNMTDIVLLVGESRLRAQVSPAVDWAVGARVDVLIPPDAISLIAKGA
jgi:ABC-type Fe3+/spermidine/putrescine transport system ATPase subunit